MKPEEKLKEIEGHFKRMNNFGWPEDVRWLIARVKKLTAALEEIKDTRWSSEEVNPLKYIARKALEGE